ncbi:hypothetical protein TPA0908_03070 [Micromonospora sp. AKA38]|nr:hypothetical protein TPA0908_03070 [Micromonospora sp. AKA38]
MTLPFNERRALTQRLNGAQSRRMGWLVSRETEHSMIPGCAGYPVAVQPWKRRSVGCDPLPFHVKRATGIRRVRSAAGGLALPQTPTGDRTRPTGPAHA